MRLSKAVTKYRRLRTLRNKLKELAEKLDLRMSLIVLEPKLNKITEYHTDDLVKLVSIKDRMDYAMNKDSSIPAQSTLDLKIVSVDVMNSSNEGQPVTKIEKRYINKR